MKTVRDIKFRIVLHLASALVAVTVFAPRAPAAQEKSPRDLFLEGNRLYSDGRFREAAESYLAILSTGIESGELYYNIGNCYYKLQETGRAILFYERAKRLLPHDEDVRTNLALANLSVVDKIEPAETFILFALARRYVHLIPRPALIGIVAASYFLAAGCAILWMLSGRFRIRRLAVRSGIGFAVLFLLSGIALAGQWNELAGRDKAVILAQKVDVLSAPGESEGIQVFSIHEGTKVTVEQTSGEWAEIVLADGKVGWVKREVLEVI